MGGWSNFILAMVVFLAAHAIPVRPAIKRAVVARLGATGFGLAYSALSVALLIWVIVAAGRAPYVPVWYFARWQADAALILMLAACLLTTYALAGVNPLSFGSRTSPFDPQRPGIAGVSRHPVLLALALWAGAHMLANGDLAHLVLFGTMAVFALLGMALIDRRKRRQTSDWPELTRATSLLPLSALITGRWHPQGWPSPWPALVALLVWAVLIGLHPLVIGVTPLDL